MVEQDAAPVQVVKIIEKPVITKEVIKEPRPVPSEGLAIGMHGAMPKLAWKYGMLDISGGYTSLAGDQKALVKIVVPFYQSQDRWTQLKAGGAVVLDSVNSYGCLLEVEQYLTPSVSVIGDVYLLRGSSTGTDIGVGALGGRLYI